MKKKFYMVSFPDAYYIDLTDDFIKALYREKSRLYDASVGAYSNGYFAKPNNYKGSYEEWRFYRENTPTDTITKEWPQYKSFKAVLSADKFLRLAETQMRNSGKGLPQADLIDIVEEV